MKHFFKFLSISMFILLMPFTVYSLIVGLFNNDDIADEYVSGHSFFTTVSAEVSGGGEGAAGGACESAGGGGAGCEGEGGK